MSISEQPSDTRTCGRPTRSGQPCKARIYGYDLACKIHASQHDRELAEAYGRGHREGFHSGQEMGTESAKARVAWLERRVTELEQRLDEANRYYEYSGDQVAEVGRYAYRWSGQPPLTVGDRVRLPENWLSRVKDGPGAQEGVVTKLGATYRGELSFIVGRIPDHP